MDKKLLEALKIAQEYIVSCEEVLENEGIGAKNMDAEEKWRAVETWLATLDSDSLEER